MPQCPTNQENVDNPLTLTPMHKYDSTINDIYTISRELNYLKAIIHFYAPEIEDQGAYQGHSQPGNEVYAKYGKGT